MTTKKPRMIGTTGGTRLIDDDIPEDIDDLFEENGWSDGCRSHVL